MPKIRGKEYQAQNVLDAALERIRYCYQHFDKVIVSFSAGKDSTALLACTIAVARELGRLPVRVVFVDEEAIHPPTIEYAERMMHNPDIAMEWYCLPVKHRNACSNEQPYWYAWNPEEEHLWVRPMPPWAIREHPTFKFGMSFQEWMPSMVPVSEGKVCVLTGIRTEESLRRYRVIASKRHDAFLSTTADNKNSYRAFPVYDWSSEDVWRLVAQWDLDYNRTYDIFNHTIWHGRYLTQRVCPPFGEEPLRGLWCYAECFPEMWHKMLYRVKGVATAWRYANTEMWSNWVKPEGKTWREYFFILLDSYEPEYKNLIKSNINQLIGQHEKKSKDLILDEIPHPITGASWKFFCKCCQKGDFKGRQKQNMMGDANKTQKWLGITLDEAIQRYGLNPTHGRNSFTADLEKAGKIPPATDELEPPTEEDQSDSDITHPGEV